MSGIYIHIPFCKQKCNYCNFHFSTSVKGIPQMITCIENEIELRKDYLNKNRIASIYFGGGTPSLVNVNYLESILKTIHSNFIIDSNAEITLEANPDDINETMLLALRKAGINRLSLGVQSFFDIDLKWMNRAHNAEEAINCITTIKQAGFTNYSVDLIYGVPGLTDAKWIQNLETLLQENVPHISCYALTVESKTELFHAIKKNNIPPLDEEQSERQYHITHALLTKYGYEHYEISNYAKTGFHAVHNSSYWEGKQYLGVGPSAHSYNGISRQWNVSSNPLYMNNIVQHIIPYEIELLTPVQQANEMIMISLRQSKGLNLHLFNEKFGDAFYNTLLENIKQTEDVFVTEGEDILIIQERFRFISDSIISNLFLEE